MNVRQLREALEGMPDNLPVILQRDAAGNGYSPLYTWDDAMYLATTSWSGECYETPAPGDDEDDDYPPEGSVPALVLVPMN